MTEATPIPPTPLDAARLPLWGSHLIEASAGTGKTWTIAALYVRLVLGHGGEGGGLGRPLLPPDILVMTFTRAATRELSDRIRARLVEVADRLRQPEPAVGADPFVQALCLDLPTEAVRREAAWRLAMAADTMDGAAIHTIDAWCQRVLREQAFESGVLWDETLLPDESAVRTEAVQDQWRQMCYPLAAPDLLKVLQVWPDLAAFAQDMARLLVLDPQPAPGNLLQLIDHAEAERAQQLASLKAQWRPWAQAMWDFQQAHTPAAAHGWNGQRFPNTYSGKWLQALLDWAQDPAAADPPALGKGWERLTPAGLQDARKDGVLPELPEGFRQLADLPHRLAALPLPTTAARWWVAGQVVDRLRVLKQRRGEVGFADMPARLLEALQGPRGEVLRQHILARYPAALVDEFQDTSPVQYAILDAIYRVQDHRPGQLLLLIGDPKQSIYAFRGADIHSYLSAKRHTEGRHHVLGTNHRSTGAVVGALNHLFAQAEAQAPEGAFVFRSEGHNPLPYVPVLAKGRLERWVGAGGEQPALLWAHDPTLRGQSEVRERYAQHCAEQVVVWLNDPENGFRQPDGAFERLRPGDIAVLVRTGSEADLVRAALGQRGVQSVYLSDRESVLGSPEARDLVYWMAAVAAPQDPQRVRAALALPTVGWPLPALESLLASDEDYDEVVGWLTALRQVWQEQGVLAMLRQTLYRLGLAARWAQTPGGERRLTNVLHLAELLQTASADVDGELALVRWLQARVDDPVPGGDEPLVRLESDADLIKVVTVHKSKGLEYPVVCVPFATAFRPPDKQKSLWATRLPQTEGGYIPVLQHSAAVEAQLVHERLREDVRLLYVALTRARHGLWVGFAAVRSGAGSTCETERSAAGYLVGAGQPREASAWREALDAVAPASAGVHVLELPDQGPPTTPLQRHNTPIPLAQPKAYAGVFDRRWGIASYSRLTRDLGHVGPGLSPWANMRDDEGGDGTTDPVVGVSHPSPAVWHTFRRGPVSGQFLHDQLEWLATEGLALNRDPGLRSRLVARCERAGYGVEAEALTDWLGRVLATPLAGVGAALQDLDLVRPEMEFWLPWDRLSSAELDRVCQAHLLVGVPRPALRASDLHGMLMGFADAVFEHGGRYWVLDHKSNHLGMGDAAYHPAALAAAMAHHRYDVQAAVYLLALHRLLQTRLGAGYDPTQHLGGAVYLFLRGVHGPAGGVCALPAPPDMLAALDALLPAAGESP